MLSNEAFLVTSAIAFWYPMPKSVPMVAGQQDKWGDIALNGSSSVCIKIQNIALTGGLVLSWMLSSAMFTLLVITASRRILSNIDSIQRIENTDLLIIEQGLPLLL